MARARATDAPDLGQAHDLTAGLIERLDCPAGKAQAFLRDKKAPGLKVRVTAAGAKAYVFETKLHRQTLRRTIGSVDAWSIDAARREANRLRVTVDAGADPRDLDRQKEEERAAAAARRSAETVTVQAAWDSYLADRKEHWGARHYADHQAMARAGGVKALRGTRGRGVTIAGPLHSLMALPLRDLTSPVIDAWAAREAKTRPTVARLAWRLLRAFLTWCASEEAYKAVVPPINPAKTKKAREAFGKAGVKRDTLLKEQLPAWFAAVLGDGSPAIAACLQTILFTGARPGEVLAMQWKDINLKWRGLTIRDKVEGERVIPLTPYLQEQLTNLPRRNAWVFASTPRGDAKSAGPISSPNLALSRACAVAGIEGLTLHGLRRSFKSLTEWLEIPAGVVAQIMGHKPSATAEKHYTVRPLDLLRVHHERIEAWMLEQAGVQFVPKKDHKTLRAVV